MGLSAVAAILAVVGAVSSMEAQRKQQNYQEKIADEQEKQNKIQAASEAERAARERRQQVREERIRRAQIIQSSYNTGVSGSSGQLGGVSSLSTQLSSNLGSNASSIEFAKEITQSNRRIGQFQQGIADSRARNANIQAISSIGQSLFSVAGASGDSIFSMTQEGTNVPVVEKSFNANG